MREAISCLTQCIFTELFHLKYHLKYVWDTFHKTQKKKKIKVRNIYSIHSIKCELSNLLLHGSPPRTVLNLTVRIVAVPASSRFQIDKPGLRWHQSQLAMGHLLNMWLNVTAPYAVKSVVDPKYRQAFFFFSKSDYIPRKMCFSP